MPNFKTLVATLLMLGTTSVATAQHTCTKDYKPAPYTFIGLQGGGQVTFTNYKASKLITPVGAFSVGHFFSPVVGTRLNVSGWKNKGGFKSVGKTYEYNYVTSNLDLMLNLSKIVMPSKCHTPLNVYLIGGVGLSYAWDNDDLNALRNSGLVKENMAWEDDRLVHNFRAGLQLEYAFAKHFAVNLEVDANNLHDRFNSKANGRGDWQLTGMVGLTYKFGFKKHKAAPVPVAPAPVKEQPAPAPKPAVVEEKPVVVEEKKEVKQPEKIRIDVFFAINSAVIRSSEEPKVKKLADWLNSHPEAKADLVGYADAGTGNAQINRTLSEKRMKAVADVLVQKYGIKASRLTTGFKGDSVQPFKNNDDNRVVISVAAE